MPTERRKYQGKKYEIFTPSDPTAGYKKMVILGYTHLSYHELLTLIVKEFASEPIGRVQIEALPHRGLTIRG